MNNKVLNLTFASSITNLCEVNSSFDSGVLRVAYTGENRNGSAISKDVFEKCMRTIFNCPIVCNYDRESDTLGGHDMEVVREKDGALTLINVTTPVGCIPESAKVFWENVTEQDGTIHEYLCAEALLWKRQEAYRKIKKDGIVAHSMEIAVKDGETINGIYHIKDFEFTAFALIGVEPCFESSSLEVFSKRDFKAQLSEMMRELKETYNLVNTPDDGVGNTKLQNHSMEGGEQVLDKNELIAKYGIDVETLDFSIEDFTFEELEEKFKAMQSDNSNSDETKTTSTGAPDEGDTDNFALMSNIVDEIVRVIDTVKVQREWGERNRYCFVDCDLELNEVYVWDTNDWLLYGFAYTMDGDTVNIDFNSKTRKKYVIADFDEGEQASPFAPVFALMEQRIRDNADWEAKYQTASGTITSMKAELDELRQFKAEAEDITAQNERDEVFARFGDLVGVEAFEALKDNCADYDTETLEEKCYAIRGRQVGTSGKFSLTQKIPKLKVEHGHTEKAPYGGLFEKYGFSTEN